MALPQAQAHAEATEARSAQLTFGFASAPGREAIVSPNPHGPSPGLGHLGRLVAVVESAGDRTAYVRETAAATLVQQYFGGPADAHTNLRSAVASADRLAKEIRAEQGLSWTGSVMAVAVVGTRAFISAPSAQVYLVHRGRATRGGGDALELEAGDAIVIVRQDPEQTSKIDANVVAEAVARLATQGAEQQAAESVARELDASALVVRYGRNRPQALYHGLIAAAVAALLAVVLLISYFGRSDGTGTAAPTSSPLTSDPTPAAAAQSSQEQPTSTSPLTVTPTQANLESTRMVDESAPAPSPPTRTPTNAPSIAATTPAAPTPQPQTVVSEVTLVNTPMITLTPSSTDTPTVAPTSSPAVAPTSTSISTPTPALLANDGFCLQLVARSSNAVIEGQPVDYSLVARNDGDTSNNPWSLEIAYGQVAVTVTNVLIIPPQRAEALIVDGMPGPGDEKLVVHFDGFPSGSSIAVSFQLIMRSGAPGETQHLRASLVGGGNGKGRLSNRLTILPGEAVQSAPVVQVVNVGSDSVSIASEDFAANEFVSLWYDKSQGPIAIPLKEADDQGVISAIVNGADFSGASQLVAKGHCSRQQSIVRFPATTP